MVVGIPGMKVLFSSVPHRLFLFFFLSVFARNMAEDILVLRPFQLYKEKKTNGGYKHYP